MTGGHLDEDGLPCAHHAMEGELALLALALVGSRAPSFHHEIASKLQRLLFSLDELDELVAAPDGRAAPVPAPVPAHVPAHVIAQARDTLHELCALLDGNRALTRAPVRQSIGLAELVGAAALRARVHVVSELPGEPVTVAVPALTHALALLLDAAVATGATRATAITFARSDTRAVLAIPVTSTTAPLASSIPVAIAAFAIARDGGELRCGSDGRRFLVHLPLDASAARSP